MVRSSDTKLCVIYSTVPLVGLFVVEVMSIYVDFTNVAAWLYELHVVTTRYARYINMTTIKKMMRVHEKGQQKRQEGLLMANERAPQCGGIAITSTSNRANNQQHI